MYSWHDFNKYKLYDTNTHLNRVNSQKSKPSRRVTFADVGHAQSRSLNRGRNSSRYGIAGQPRGLPKCAAGGSCANNPVKDRRLTTNWVRLFGSNLIDQSALSETRAAFNTPKNGKNGANLDNSPRGSSLLEKIRAESNSKPKLQESPPFSLRKVPTKSKIRNKVIDAKHVAKQIEIGKINAKNPENEKERKLFVLRGISSFSTPHNFGPQYNSFGLLEDPKKFVLAATGTGKVESDRFRFIVDMSEYHNEQIQFMVKGRKLIIEGTRPQEEPWISERKTIEAIELPPRVHADNLRIDRDSNGLLFFQEAWKF